MCIFKYIYIYCRYTCTYNCTNNYTSRIEDMELKHGHIYEEHGLKQDSMFWNLDSMLNLGSVYGQRSNSGVSEHLDGLGLSMSKYSLDLMVRLFETCNALPVQQFFAAW